jgi:hypothetical protein
MLEILIPSSKLMNSQMIFLCILPARANMGKQSAACILLKIVRDIKIMVVPCCSNSWFFGLQLFEVLKTYKLKAFIAGVFCANNIVLLI